MKISFREALVSALVAGALFVGALFNSSFWQISSAEAQVAVEHFDARQGDFSLVGSAYNEDLSYLSLTKQLGSEAGAAWITAPKNLSYGFELEFDVTLDPPDQTSVPPQDARGADGIVVVFQKQGVDALGSPGQGIGAYRNNTYGGSGITNAFGIELDTYQNINDCPAPHLAVQGMYLTGEMSGESNQSLLPCAILPERIVGYHRLTIRYDAGILTVLLDNIERIHRPFVWPLSDANVWIGVTAGNGAVQEAQAHSLFAIELRNRLNPTQNPQSCQVADWSMNGEVSIHDLFSFLESYFTAATRLSLGDLFSFLGSFFLCRH